MVETVISNHKRPWKLSFSFGRALQASVLRAWGGADTAEAIKERVQKPIESYKTYKINA